MKVIRKRGKIDLIAVIILALLVIVLLTESRAINSGTNGSANLVIYSTGSFNKLNLTLGSIYSKTQAHWNFYFYANFTNSTEILNSTYANCTISFNETGNYGDWLNLSYNSSSLLWEYNRSFIYKGNLSFQANCTSYSGNISLEDYFYVRNTPPYVDLLSTIQFYKNESNGTYSLSNFSEYVTENDANDNLTYSIENITCTRYSETSAGFYYWIRVNSSTGLISSNATYDNQTDNFYLTIRVVDTGNSGVDVEPILKGVYLNITAVNDPPEIEVANKTLPVLELFEYIIPVVDEEGNAPYTFNITFIGCNVAEWSTRNSSNCSLFNSSQYLTNTTSINISFIPSRNDVGNYTINFTVIDSGNPNATTSVVVNFSVTNSNLPPLFTYLCDNNRNTSENSNFTCIINASDIDETRNLTFITNYSWFKFNGTNSNSINVPVNITSGYNASVLVNFTPSNTEVGNWSVNVSVLDTSGGINSSVFWFFINNSEDLPSLDSIGNITIYENKTLYVNATDDDLLVPDKNVENETLSFSSDVSWVYASSAYSALNYKTAKIEINYNEATGGQNYTVKINVTDRAGNVAERYFDIQVLGDTPAEWLNPETNIVIYENNYTYLNLSQNVSDSNGDSINFSFTNDTIFPTFSLNSSTGIINFTPADFDVGYHNITINASDGKLNSFEEFNFTVYNVNDAPYIESIANQAADEDTVKSIQLYIQDEDLKIPQTGFYYENFSINITFQGNNGNLFNFSLINRTLSSNRSYYIATFTPRKADTGNYNITINATDAGNLSYRISFNLTISSINHVPSLMNFTNYTSKINSSFYLQINVSDIEDGNSTEAGNTNFTFSYNFLSGTSFFNITTFNSTTGIINILLNDSHSGNYRINVSVSDSFGKNNSGDFWLFIYNNPLIITPPGSYQFGLFEANQSNLTFEANHSVKDNLTYYFYIDRNNARELRYNLSYYGNNTNLTWIFNTNYTDETYGTSNLTLLVLNPLYPELNSSASWNITINHTNYPVNFTAYISDKETTYLSPITISLGDYFSDIDYSDAAYNQTVNFSVTSNSTPSIVSSVISDWVLTISASSAASERLRIDAFDLNSTGASMSNASSNNFLVTFTTPQTIVTPTPSGGGGTTVKLEHYSIKIIVPGDVVISDKNYIEIPIVIQNTGQVNLKGISLSGLVSFNNLLSGDVKLAFANSYLDELGFGQTANLTVKIFADTQKAGRYKVSVFANVTSPKFSDWGDFFIELIRVNETEAEQMLVFTEKMISENPECLELTELVKEARNLFEQNKYTESREKAQEAVTACEETISKNPIMRRQTSFGSSALIYVGLGAILVFVLWIIIYIYKKVKFNKDKRDGYV